ncbi:MAG TPA: hypothetical protein VMN79_04435 [Casimicrobiaceae bacterium]|nr:hypothetical protein [Casimicrobiaceae bacterium]
MSSAARILGLALAISALAWVAYGYLALKGDERSELRPTRIRPVENTPHVGSDLGRRAAPQGRATPLPVTPSGSPGTSSADGGETAIGPNGLVRQLRSPPGADDGAIRQAAPYALPVARSSM